MLELLEAVIAGILQGLLEWIPVSSRGNVAVVMVKLLGLDPRNALGSSILLHVGTSLAGLVYFRKEVAGILLRRTEKDRALFNYLFIATTFTGLIGLPIYLLLDATVAQGEAILAVTGVALLAAGLLQRAGGRAQAKDAKLGAVDAVILGVVQGLSAIPGLSRSGLTTSALLLKGLDSEEAFRVSFLMSIPASLAASLGITVIRGVDAPLSFLAPAILVAFAVGYLSMDALLRLAKRVEFWRICLLLGAAILLGTLPSLLNIV